MPHFLVTLTMMNITKATMMKVIKATRKFPTPNSCATMEYAKTKNILHVMQMLGHKNIQNRLVYTHLINLENDEFHTDVAESIEKACKLIDTGFKYVTGEYNDGGKIFRKRK
jgi:hypothetical protein